MKKISKFKEFANGLNCINVDGKPKESVIVYEASKEDQMAYNFGGLLSQFYHSEFTVLKYSSTPILLA